MKTYNFIIFCGKIQFGLEINANSQDEALDIVSKEYPTDAGWYFILL